MAPAPGSTSSENVTVADPSNGGQVEQPTVAPGAESVGTSAPAAPEQAASSSSFPTPPSSRPLTPEQDAELHRQRYAGLQGVFTQERQARIAAEQARAAAEQRAQQLESAGYEQQWRLQGLGPDQITANRRALQAHQELQRRAATLQAQQQRLAEERAVMEVPARHLVIAQIAQHYGVPPARIAHLASPEAMEAAAQAYRDAMAQAQQQTQQQTRTAALQQRREQKVDRAEAGGSGGIDISRMNPLERIKEGLRRARSG